MLKSTLTFQDCPENHHHKEKEWLDDKKIETSELWKITAANWGENISNINKGLESLTQRELFSNLIRNIYLKIGEQFKQELIE